MTYVKFNRKPFESNLNNLFEDLFADASDLFKTDFKVNIDQNILTISVEKKDEKKDESEKQIRKEYGYRSFKRSFTLDEKIDATNIDAKYVNGVLTLNLPKKEIVKPSAQEISI